MIAMGKMVRKILLVALLLVVTSGGVFAQPDPPDDGEFPGDPPDPDDVPITGIEVLLTVGGAWGIKRILDNRRNKK